MNKKSCSSTSNVGTRLKELSYKYKNELIAYTILLIPLAIWITFSAFAFIRSFVLSFTDWSFVSKNFIGFANYIEAFKDDAFLIGLKNTTIWTFFILIGVNGMGLMLAFALNKVRNLHLQKVFLFLLFWPCLVSATVSAELQKYIFSSMNTGLMNVILMNLHIITKPLGWIDDPNMALLSIMIMPFFFGFGIKMIIYYVGIQSIDDSYYEAAALETDSQWHVFWRITMPLLQPILLVNLVLSLIEGFKVIAPMQLITYGGPDNATMSVVLKMYTEAFESFRFGYASAIAIILFLITLLITIVQFKLKGKSYDE